MATLQQNYHQFQDWLDGDLESKWAIHIARIMSASLPVLKVVLILMLLTFIGLCLGWYAGVMAFLVIRLCGFSTVAMLGIFLSVILINESITIFW
ncbi:MAG: hypothetical protein O3C20_17975 [Verrucomicrobia bacterium]|nr:hypothetical protein [Verrucomicrobiota bacterium]